MSSASFRQDFAAYLNLIRVPSASRSDILATFQSSRQQPGRSHQLVIVGLLLTYPSVLSGQLGTLTECFNTLILYCVKNAATVELAFLQEAQRLLRRLSSEFYRHALNLKFVDPKAEAASQPLNPVLDGLNPEMLEKWQDFLHQALKKRDPAFAAKNQASVDKNQEVFHESQPEEVPVACGIMR